MSYAVVFVVIGVIMFVCANLVPMEMSKPNYDWLAGKGKWRPEHLATYSVTGSQDPMCLFIMPWNKKHENRE